MNEIKNSKVIDNKIIGCAAIILVGICYKDQKNYLNYGLNILKKISTLAFDSNGFPRSRNIKQLILYLKYYILIREWFKEAQIEVPEHINETIYHLGQSYAFTWQNSKFDILMNGNNISNNLEFDQYLKRFNYTFKNENYEFGGYAILSNKKISIVVDVGAPRLQNFHQDINLELYLLKLAQKEKTYQQLGNYEGKSSKLVELSKSTATHNTLVIDDTSSCHYRKSNGNFIVNDGLKILKRISFLKKLLKVSASHDGYHKKYNTTHEREIEFYPEKFKFIGTDKILSKKLNFNIKFDIRFHLEPNVKLMKTQDNKAILIELENEGWKFTCEKFDINIDNGLYFGNKNSYTQNQNIFISGITNKLSENIIWQISKI